MMVLGDIDRAIVYFFNRDLANPVFDIFFVTIANSKFLKAAMSLVIVFLVWKGGRKGRVVALLAIGCVLFTDLTTHYVLKEMFCRYRPSHVLPGLRLPVGYGGLHGLPSNHAANMFGLAFLISFFYRRAAIPFFVLATLACFSRIYVGKHYPSDILAGALYGALVAAIFIYLGRRYRQSVPGDSPKGLQEKESPLTQEDGC